MTRLPLLLALLCTAACTVTTRVTDLHGMPNTDGRRFELWQTSCYAMNLLFVIPIPFVGDDGIEHTVSELTEAAEAAGTGGVRIVQHEADNLWWIFPPLSFVFTPVVGRVTAEVLLPAGGVPAAGAAAARPPVASRDR